MMRFVLFLFGCIMLLFHQYVIHLSIDTQLIIFLTGIVLLGIPHGAADLLVASRTADASRKRFSKVRFLTIYISRLVLFAAILWFFPVAGNLLFIFFAAYHFGETDLNQFKTDTLLGKLFVITYGSVILSVILLHHFEEVKPFFQLFQSGKENTLFIDWIGMKRYSIMTIVSILFFVTCFAYFLKNSSTNINEKGLFLIRFAAILLILYYLPMLLGFTFYFVAWHSVLSLNNIVSYLRNNNTYSRNVIVKQILLYSVLAIAGIGIFGLTGFMFTSNNAIAGYIFLGLAVLTAPHMQIMHDMYIKLRISKSALS